MTSPGGKQVGRVSVKVVPDTSKFASELKAKLEKIERDLQVVIDVALDTTQAVAQAKALEKQLESNPIDIPVNLNTRGANFSGHMRSLRRAARSLGGPLNAVGKAFEAIADGIDAATNSMIRARRATGAIVSQTVIWVAQTVRGVLTLDNAKRAWASLSDAVKATSKAAREIPSIVLRVRDLALSAASAFRRGAEFLRDEEGWTRRFQRIMFEVWTVVGNTENAFKKLGRGIRALGSAEAWSRGVDIAMFHLWGGIGRIEKAFKRLRNFNFRNIFSTFKRLGTAALNAGRNISRSIGRGLDRGIKGIGSSLSGAVRGIGKLFGKAGDAVSGFAGAIAGMSKFALIGTAVLALLAPALGLVVGLLAAIPAGIFLLAAPIAAIALGLDGVKAAAKAAEPAFNKLKDTISATFEKNLTPVFKQINDKLLPGITKGMEGVAEGVSGIAEEFVNVLTSAEGLKQLDSILGNIKKFFEGLRPFVKEFTDAFLTLADVGSQRFGDMAKSMSAWARDFNKVVQDAAGSGRLQAAFDGLGEVIGAIGRAFNRLFDSGLDSMAKLGKPIANLIDGFVDLFVALEPALSAVSGLVFDTLGDAMSALSPVVEKLTEPFLLLVELVGKLLGGAIEVLTPLLEALAGVLGGVLTPLFEELSPIIDDVIGFLVELAKLIGESITQAFEQLSPFIEEFIKFIGELLKAITPLLPPLAELAGEVMKALLEILPELMPYLKELAETVFPKLVELVKLLVPVIIEMIGAWGEVIGIIAEVIGFLLDQLFPVFEALLGVVESVWPQISGIISGAMKVIRGIIDFFLGIVTGDWRRSWEGLKGILSGAWDIIFNAVKGSINLVLSLIRALPGNILGSLGDLGKLLWNSGVSLVQGFINGIKSMAGRLAGVVGDVLKSARNFFPFSPAKTGPFAGRGYTLYSGRALAEDFAKGIEDRAHLASAAVESMMGSANNSATAEWRGLMKADGFGAIGDRIAEALDGMEMKADGHNIAKVVNDRNNSNRRR